MLQPIDLSLLMLLQPIDLSLLMLLQPTDLSLLMLLQPIDLSLLMLLQPTDLSPSATPGILIIIRLPCFLHPVHISIQVSQPYTPAAPACCHTLILPTAKLPAPPVPSRPPPSAPATRLMPSPPP